MVLILVRRAGSVPGTLLPAGRALVAQLTVTVGTPAVQTPLLR